MSCPGACKDCALKERLTKYQLECDSKSPNGVTRLKWLLFQGGKYGCGVCFNYVCRSDIKRKSKMAMIQCDVSKLRGIEQLKQHRKQKLREKARTMTLEKLVYLPKPLRDADPDLGVTVNAIPNSNWHGTLHIADCDVVPVNSLTSLDDCVDGIYLHYELLLLNLLHGEQHHSCSTTIMSCSCSTCCFTPDSKWSELTTPAQLAAWRAASKPLTEVSNLQQLHRMLKSMRIVDKRNSNLDFC